MLGLPLRRDSCAGRARVYGSVVREIRILNPGAQDCRTEETEMIDRTPPTVHLRIGAERRTSGSGGVYQHVNPATGQPDAEIPLAGAVEVDEAVRAAHAAFAGWRATRPAGRRRLLN